MRPTGQQDRALDGTHGRIKRRKKSFYEMKKAAYAKTILLPFRPRWEVEKSLFCKGFTELQTAIFEEDDECIVAVQNGVLTGNNRQE